LFSRIDEADEAVLFKNGKYGIGFTSKGRVDESSVELRKSDLLYLVLRKGSDGWLLSLDKDGNLKSEVELDVKQRLGKKGTTYTPLRLHDVSTERVRDRKAVVTVSTEYNVCAYNQETHKGDSRVDITTGYYGEDKFGNTTRDEEFSRWKGDGEFLKFPAE
jgi:hypothetical protein